MQLLDNFTSESLYSEGKNDDISYGFLPIINGEFLVQPIRREIRKLLKRNGLSRFKNTLEFGCGLEENFSFLSSLTERYYGVDFTKEENPQGQDNIVAFKGNYLPFGDCSFDLICSFWILQYIVAGHKLCQIVKEFHRILKPHSYVLICEKSSGLEGSRLPEEYISIFRSLSFELSDIRKIRKKRLSLFSYERADLFKKYTEEGDNIYIFQRK